jgi:hypothetical protein
LQETGAAVSTHKKLSLIKSSVRLLGCGFGMAFFWHQFLPLHAFAFLFLAEIIGIVEEFYELPVSDSYKAFSTRTMCTAEALGQGAWANPLPKDRYDEDGGARP